MYQALVLAFFIFQADLHLDSLISVESAADYESMNVKQEVFLFVLVAFCLSFDCCH